MRSHRLEVQLNPSNAEAQQLIDEMDALPPEYGLITAYLKDRLVRGFLVFRREIDALKSQEDPLKALDARAKSGAEFRSQYRILQFMLGLPVAGAEEGARSAVAEAPPTTSKRVKPEPAARGLAPVEGSHAPSRVGSVGASPAGAQALAPGAPASASAAAEPASRGGVPEGPSDIERDTVGQVEGPSVPPSAREQPGTEVAPNSDAQHVEAGDGQVPAATPASPPTRNWSRFQGIAGTKGSGG